MTGAELPSGSQPCFAGRSTICRWFSHLETSILQCISKWRVSWHRRVSLIWICDASCSDCGRPRLVLLAFVRAEGVSGPRSISCLGELQMKPKQGSNNIDADMSRHRVFSLFHDHGCMISGQNHVTFQKLRLQAVWTHQFPWEGRIHHIRMKALDGPALSSRVSPKLYWALGALKPWKMADANMAYSCQLPTNKTASRLVVVGSEFPPYKGSLLAPFLAG